MSTEQEQQPKPQNEKLAQPIVVDVTDHDIVEMFERQSGYRALADEKLKLLKAEVPDDITKLAEDTSKDKATLKENIQKTSPKDVKAKLTAILTNEQHIRDARKLAFNSLPEVKVAKLEAQRMSRASQVLALRYATALYPDWGKAHVMDLANPTDFKIFSEAHKAELNRKTKSK
jgi:hypothetical protein